MEDGCLDWQSPAVRPFFFDYDLSLTQTTLPRTAPFLLNETHAIDRLGAGTYQSPYIRLHSSNGRWKRRSALRRSGGGVTHVRARANPRRSGKRWSSPSKANNIDRRFVTTSHVFHASHDLIQSSERAVMCQPPHARATTDRLLVW